MCYLNWLKTSFYLNCYSKNIIMKQHLNEIDYKECMKKVVHLKKKKNK